MDNITGYGNLYENYTIFDDSRIVVLPVPYDGTSTWGKGADKGPDAIIEASANMELYDIETDSEVYKRGIHTAEPVTENESPEKMARAVQERIKDLLDRDKFVVTVGGEHSVSIGAFEAHASHFRDISILQLDAHADLREEYMGSRYNHACVMSRARELCPIVQAGIRSMDISEKPSIQKGRIFFPEYILNSKCKWIDEVVSVLTPKVYITIDLDVFDISIMPATGTPEPGGLSWYDVLALLKRIAGKREIVGFDVVELCPSESSKPYDFLAAKLIYKLLSYKFEKA